MYPGVLKAIGIHILEMQVLRAKGGGMAAVHVSHYFKPGELYCRDLA